MRQNPLLYPAGFSPGFDPSHIANRRGPVLFSAANLGSGFVNLLTSKPGTKAGAPTQLLSRAGPSSKMAGAADAFTFPVSTAATAAQTLAAIVTFDTFASFGGIICTSGNSGYVATTTVGNQILVRGTTITLNGTMVTGRPYFVVASISLAVGKVVTIRDLVTGQIFTGIDAGETPATPSGTAFIGPNNALVQGCTLSTGAVIAGALNANEQLAWARDPWGYWYPSAAVTKLSSLVGVAAGGSPSGTLAATDTPDAAAFAGAYSVQGSLATTEGIDTAAIAGNTVNSGTLATTDTADAAAFSGSVFIGGILATSDTADTASINGSVFIGGTLAATEAADAAALSGNAGTTGTLGATESQDVAAFVSTSNVSGTLAATEAQDSASLSGNTGASGSLAVTETADSAALAGSVFDGGVLAATEAADSLSFSGNIGASGPFVATDSPDSAAFAGAFIVTGTFAASESPDVLRFSSASAVSGTLSTTDYGDVASFVLTAFPPNYNPLERLKMYTGTLGAVSNREDWIVNISFIDTDGNALDISTAQSIVTYVCRQGCPNSPVLSASLTDKIILTDNYTLQWAFPETDMQNLCASQYDVFCRVEMNDITTQILSANVAILEGGPQ